MLHKKREVHGKNIQQNEWRKLGKDIPAKIIPANISISKNRVLSQNTLIIIINLIILNVSTPPLT